METRSQALAAVAFTLLLGAPARAQVDGAPPGLDHGHVPDPGRASELLETVPDVLLLMEGSDPIQSIVGGLDLVPVEVVASKGLHRLRPGPSVRRADLTPILQTLLGDPRVIVTEINRRADTPETGCSLPLAVGAQQCTIGVVDGTPTSEEYLGQYTLDSIQAEEAQELSLKTPVVVAVVDTGLDFTHPLFAGRTLGRGYDCLLDERGGVDVPNGFDDDGDGAADEAYGHGTHIAGTILLVNPDALLLSVRALDADGNGTAFDVAQGIFWAVDNGAQIVNLSLSMAEESLIVSSALAYAESLGVRVFSSAGNTGTDTVLYPANYDPIKLAALHIPFLPQNTPITGLPIYSVAAVDRNDELASFSAYGFDVDVCAPGVDVYSAVPGGGYGWWSGTSMACAVASGAASLTLSVWDQVWPRVVAPGQLLLITADPINSINPGLTGMLGAGRINALSAAMVLVQ